MKSSGKKHRKGNKAANISIQTAAYTHVTGDVEDSKIHEQSVILLKLPK